MKVVFFAQSRLAAAEIFEKHITAGRQAQHGIASFGFAGSFPKLVRVL